MVTPDEQSPALTPKEALLVLASCTRLEDATAYLKRREEHIRATERAEADKRVAEAERAMREQAASIADRMEFDSFHRGIGNQSYGLGFEDGCNHYAAFIADAIRALPLSSDEGLTEQERQALLLTAQETSERQDPPSSG